MIYADIIVDISHEKVDRSFQYKVPEELQHKLQVGMVVTIPFGNGNHERKGYVIGLSDTPAFDTSRMKELTGICSSDGGEADRACRVDEKPVWLHYGSGTENGSPRERKGQSQRKTIYHIECQRRRGRKNCREAGEWTM